VFFYLVFGLREGIHLDSSRSCFLIDREDGQHH